LEPLASFLPGLGLCEMTLPFFTVFDLAFVTLPVLQCPAAIFRFAAASRLPFTFGTVHFVVVGAALGVTAFDADDCSPVPTAFFAATLNVYVVPFVSSVTVAEVTVATVVAGCALVPMYGVIT